MTARPHRNTETGGRETNTVFMLIERMIQLPQENSFQEFFVELSVIIFYESN